MRFIVFFLAIATLGYSCEKDQEVDYQVDIKKWNDFLTKVIMQDVFTPPVSGRIYAYSNLIAYEVLQKEADQYQSMEGIIHDLKALPDPDHEVHYPVAALVAYAFTSEYLVLDKVRMNITEHHKLTDFADNILDSLKTAGMDAALLDRSFAYGKKVSTEFIKWIKTDGYKDRHYPTFKVSEKPGSWAPTPPSYFAAVEPNWHTMRTFFLDSGQEFSVGMINTPFSSDPKSSFYREAMDVYEALEVDRPDRIAIAEYWDCNPNVVIGYAGNVKIWDQKISPGGHWLSIANQASEQAKLPPLEALRRSALTAMVVHDAFVSCWDVKYKTNLIRPET
jgi:hypothetical protein